MEKFIKTAGARAEKAFVGKTMKFTPKKTKLY